ncbi:hypothetical protein ACFWY9_16515 [Amycolatopsis sp. NPDC059027]|uniref:hypothetical protein n=1 Tax=Amycolatopsis sp. NPDC059027 TaxID=3346709 RepID=UPI003672111B
MAAAVMYLGDGNVYALAPDAHQALADMRTFPVGIPIPDALTEDALDLVAIDGVSLWRYQPQTERH